MGLIMGRAEHACGHYVHNDIVVSATCCYNHHNLTICCDQVHLVVGGGGGSPHGPLDTTEILYEGGDSWAEGGALPQALITLKAVSINNNSNK